LRCCILEAAARPPHSKTGKRARALALASRAEARPLLIACRRLGWVAGGRSISVGTAMERAPFCYGADGEEVIVCGDAVQDGFSRCCAEVVDFASAVRLFPAIGFQNHAFRIIFRRTRKLGVGSLRLR